MKLENKVVVIEDKIYLLTAKELTGLNRAFLLYRHRTDDNQAWADALALIANTHEPKLTVDARFCY